MKVKRKFDTLKEEWKNRQAGTPYQKKITELLSEETIFTFPEGIPAFEDGKDYIIVLNPKIKPFVYLKSMDIEGLGFVCIDPFIVSPDFNLNLPAKTVSLLDIKDPNSVMVLTLVTVEKNPKETTANFLAPIIINIENNKAQQVIIDEKNAVRYRIWEALEKLESN